MKDWVRKMAEAEAEADAGIAAGGSSLFDRTSPPPTVGGSVPDHPAAGRAVAATGARIGGEPALLAIARAAADLLAGIPETHREAALTSFVGIVRGELIASTEARKISDHIPTTNSSGVAD